jgi:hypothetical protein
VPFICRVHVIGAAVANHQQFKRDHNDAATPVIATEIKLPKEVTPALRAACETDVRRLCIGAEPTIAKVKSCVMEKFLQLGNRAKPSWPLRGSPAEEAP